MAEIVSILVVALLVPAAIVAVRRFDWLKQAANRRMVKLEFPRGVEPHSVESFVRSLSGLRLPYWRRVVGQPAIVFEVQASRDEVDFRLIMEAGSRDFVLGQLRNAIPGIRMSGVESRAFIPTLAAELRLSSTERQLSVDRPGEVSSAMLSALRPLAQGEQLLIQWVLSPSRSSNDQSAIRTSLLTRLWSPASPQQPKPDKAMRAKAATAQFLAAVRLAAIADSAERSRQLLRRLIGPFHIVNAPHVSFRRRLVPSRLVSRRIQAASTPLFDSACVLNAPELAALLAMPTGDVVIPGLTLGRARQLPVPTSLPETGPAFAVSNYPDSTRQLTFGHRSLPYHGWVMGGTGSGKSNLLLHLLVAYMRAGATIVIFDSKRDLVRDFTDVIDRGRIHDLVLIDPADRQPAGVNVLAGSVADAGRTADQLVGTFMRLWPGAVGPRSQDILRAGFLTLMQTPGMTLVELPLLLLDQGFRRRLVARIDDPIVLEPQWAAYDNLSAAERAAHIAAPLNKVRAVLARKALRDIVGQSQGLDIAQVLERGGILAVPLSKGLIGEDSASLLGSILLLRVWQVLTARMGLASTDRRPVLIVLDEFQDYMAVPLSFGDMLAQARALGVGVVAAHQHLGQLPGRLRQDLRANARTKVVFQLAAPDARSLAQEFSPFLSVEDLQGLEKYEVAAQICVDGRVLPPATGTTFPPPETTGIGDRARQYSREQYGRNRQDIETEIRRRHGERPGAGTVGRRRRA